MGSGFSHAVVCIGVLLTTPIASRLEQDQPRVARGTIAGVVVDQSGDALPGASLTIMPQTVGTVVARTDSGRDGAFVIAGVPQGTYRIDAALQGFELIRANNVRVDGGGAVLRMVLPVAVVCECVYVKPPAGPLVDVGGQVVDESDAPIPRARLEIAASDRREIARADLDGRFRVLLKKDVAWALTVSATGFRPATRQVSGRSSPVRIKLKVDERAAVPSLEQLTDGCHCGNTLFTHAIR